MGEIVCGFATSHVLFPSTGVQAQARRVVDGFTEIGRRISAAGADLVVLISSEHGPTLPPSGPQPPFAVATGASIRTFGEMGIPRTDLPAHPAFALGLVRHAAAAGVDIAPVAVFRADHGTAIPALMTAGESPRPIVPIIVNSLVPEATASPARCHLLGRLLADYVATRPERVAVIGCGGLSHWPGTPEMGRINEDFDREFLRLLGSGRGERAATWSTEYIAEHAGNGGLEIRNWIAVAGALGGRGGETLYYEPIHPWATGMAAFAFAM